MRVKPKVIKVLCGGWVADGEEGNHFGKCEYCQAIQEHNMKKMGRVFAAMVVLIASGFIAFVLYMVFS